MHRPSWPTLLIVLVIALAACAPAPDMPYVQLNNITPAYDDRPPTAHVAPLRVAVAAVISPKGNLESYGPLLDYLAARLDRPVEMVQRRTYAQVNELIRQGEVDVAFVCTSAYIAGKRDFGMQLLIAPVINGQAIYYSYLIVPTDSPAQDIVDLKDKMFAFTDPISTSGRNYPVWLLRQMGYDPETFFARTFFTYSHDDAIRAVADGLADGAAVDSLVYDFALKREPALAGQVKMIGSSMPFGAPPVVVGPDTHPELRAELTTLLATLHETAEGRAVLQAMGVDRFVAIDDSAYDTARQIEREANP